MTPTKGEVWQKVMEGSGQRTECGGPGFHLLQGKDKQLGMFFALKTSQGCPGRVATLLDHIFEMVSSVKGVQTTDPDFRLEECTQGAELNINKTNEKREGGQKKIPG